MKVSKKSSVKGASLSGRWAGALVACGLLAGSLVPSRTALAGGGEAPDYLLSPGDILHIQVFQNQDLTLDTRVTESGLITFPLIGAVPVGGISSGAAEREIAKRLDDGGFVNKPQVTVVPTQIHGNQVSVLGQVNRPGRFPLDTSNIHLSEILAVAGGVAQTGADTVIITGSRDGKPFRREVDVPRIFLEGNTADDVVLAGGDEIYVHRAPMFFIYGEAQRPGTYRIERAMTLQQALATGGGLTPRGSETRIRVTRTTADGGREVVTPTLNDRVQPDDVIYVRESLF